MALEQNGQKTMSEQGANAAVSSRKFSVLGWLLFVIVLAASGYYYYDRSTNTSKPTASPWRTDPGRAIPVQAATVQRSSFDVYLEALGTVTAAQTVVVHSRVDGQLLGLHFKEGDSVKAGALLAEIDPRPYQVQLTQAEGQMARDRAQLENAKADLQRYRILLTQDSVSQQQVDTQEALVAQYEGLLKFNQGQIDSAKLNLDYTRVTAPISGRLGLRRVDVGNMVRASDPNGIVVITQEEPIDVMFTLAENDLPKVVRRVYAGVRFPVEAWDRAQKTLLESGTLMTVDNQIDIATGTVKLKARFNNKNHVLFPNQFVNVRMKIDELQDVLLAPSAAVQRGSLGTFVYVVGSEGEMSGKVSVRQITPSEEGDGKLVIDQGLVEGERLVIDGTDRLREGSNVEIITLDGEPQALPAPGSGRPEGGRPAEGAPSQAPSRRPQS
jgi:multidrug efflux system membrane fusion protein